MRNKFRGERTPRSFNPSGVRKSYWVLGSQFLSSVLPVFPNIHLYFRTLDSYVVQTSKLIIRIFHQNPPSYPMWSILLHVQTIVQCPSPIRGYYLTSPLFLSLEPLHMHAVRSMWRCEYQPRTIPSLLQIKRKGIRAIPAYVVWEIVLWGRRTRDEHIPCYMSTNVYFKSQWNQMYGELKATQIFSPNQNLQIFLFPRPRKW